MAVHGTCADPRKDAELGETHRRFARIERDGWNLEHDSSSAHSSLGSAVCRLLFGLTLLPIEALRSRRAGTEGAFGRPSFSEESVHPGTYLVSFLTN